MRILLFLIFCGTVISYPQVYQFPYNQNFDSAYITPPALPVEWSSTQNRTANTNDFTTTTSTVYSTPKAVVSTNARISQSLISPIFNFTEKFADSIKFFERRSSSHDSAVLLEASTDGGATYNIQISDTMKYIGHTNYFQRRFKLPDILDNQKNVKFQWRVIGNGTGTTGTIRFDNITITTRTLVDVGVIKVTHSPLFPTAGDSVIITTILGNFGIQSIRNITVKLYIDANLDSLAQVEELFSTINLDTTILQFDTTTVSQLIPWLGRKELQLIVNAEVLGDENSTNNQKIIRITYGVKPFSVVVNEIMYRPTSPEPEWVEIYNTTNDSINIKLWKISDHRTAIKANITNIDYLLKSGEYAIITKDSTLFKEIRDKIEARVFNVPTLPAFNNDSDAVVIFDSRGKIIDSIFYKSTWGGSGGKSLERIEPTAQSVDKSNWGTSKHPDGCTPGKKNFLTPKEFDLTISKIFFDPLTPIKGDELTINATIFNKGKQSAENYSVSFYFDNNLDSIPQPDELLSTQQPLLSLLPKDSITFSTQLFLNSHQFYKFIVVVNFPIDEDTLNNISKAEIFCGYSSGTVVINELMYAPVGGEPEWVELYNTSTDTIDLKDWKLSNRNSAAKYKIASIPQYLNPLQYVIITKDTSLLFSKRTEIPSTIIQSISLPTFLFHNSADAAVLFDNRNAVIDSMFYYSRWGGTGGLSLERIEPTSNSLDSANWGSSTDSSGATPGKQNYLTPLEHNLTAMRLFVQKVLPNEPIIISIVIKNSGKNSATNYNVNLYCDVNLDSIPDNSEFISSQFIDKVLQPNDSNFVNIVWSNFSFGQKYLIAVIDYENDLRKSDNYVRGMIRISFPMQSVIINEIMYEPLSGKSEYVELYNRANVPVEINYWKIHDQPNAAGKVNEFKLGDSKIILPPDSYLILAADSSIIEQFNLNPIESDNYAIHIFNKSSLSLDNDGDEIVLKDLTGVVIDSVKYSPLWHNPEVDDVRGRSLERINPFFSGGDLKNWGTCTAIAGGTPGRQNSIYTTAITSAAAMAISPNPFSPDGDGFDDYTIVSYNLPATVAMIRIRIFDAKGRLIRTLVNNEPSGSKGQFIWDGTTDQKQKARIGIYIILLEAFNANGGNLITVKGISVLAGILN